jgi:aspartate racemase
MGPAATADFIGKLTAARNADRDQDHVPSITCCLPDIPDRTEAIINNGPSPLPAMLHSLSILERSGVGRIAIPCNTAHYWFDDLQRRTRIPLIHIVDAVKNALSLRGLLGDCIGLLATTATVTAGVYTNRLAIDGIRCVVPTADDQRSLMNVIRHIKGGHRDEICAQVIRALSARLMHQGAHAVILGCTELPLMVPGNDGELIDSTQALAQECVRLSPLAPYTDAFA